MRRAAAVIVVVGACLGLVAPLEAQPNPPIDLASQVQPDGVFRHLRAFQRFADRNGGTRASGTPGYDESADYVARRLRAAGFDVTEQQFMFEFTQDRSTLQRTAPTSQAYERGVDFFAADFSANATVAGTVVGVDLVLPPGEAANTSTSGCETADFAAFPAGAIALVQRGTCPFTVKALNAQAAGAIGVIIFNEGQPGRTQVLHPVGVPPFPTLPVVGATFELGRDLAQTEGATVRINADVVREERATRNVIAQTKTGRTDNVVMAGAHLDSVVEGPGINDNGSGTAALLEIATKLGGSPPVNNAVRFAFWGAEENGLIGSEHYVDSLDFDEQLDIALYLNFDMVGSPNTAYFVYDGDDSDQRGAGPGPFGSAQIEAALAGRLQSRGVPTEGTDFDGRSDYGPFIAVGIPSGGLFTGAEGLKTPAQAAKWGGRAGEPFDPCYHLSCDTLGNVSYAAIAANLDAIANAIGHFAHSTREITGIGPADARAEQRAGAAALAAADDAAGGADPVPSDLGATGGQVAA